MARSTRSTHRRKRSSALIRARKGPTRRCSTNSSNPKPQQFPPTGAPAPRGPENPVAARPEGAPPARPEGGFAGGGGGAPGYGGGGGGYGGGGGGFAGGGGGAGSRDRDERRGPPQPQNKHRVNREIRFPQIRVIGPDGDQLGIITPDEGRRIAGELGLDLVEVAPEARPPVCRIMDYGKYRYELSKKAKPQKTAKLKTIKLRPKTGDHDLDTKLNHARAFLKEGDRVRFVMRLRGRENAYIERWCEALIKDLEALNDMGHMSVRPRAEGKAIVAQIDPK